MGRYPDYQQADLERVRALAGAAARPSELGRALDEIPYEDDWRSHYAIKSVRTSLHSPHITCIDAAILSYGLLELLFPEAERQLLAIHRRDAKGEECGHCVTVYRQDGRLGSFGKSSFPGLGHRQPVFADVQALAVSYADAYVKMGFTPLYFGTARLEEVGADLDWRCGEHPLNVLSERLQARYQYSFGLAA